MHVYIINIAALVKALVSIVSPSEVNHSMTALTVGHIML